MQVSVRGLTIQQPYAQLIADGHKWIENRGWRVLYRGLIAIHAGKGTKYLGKGQKLKEFITGSIVAVCELEACLDIKILRGMETEDLQLPSGRTRSAILAHEHAEGRWLWLLRDVMRLADPIELNGRQGLWKIDEKIEAGLHEQWVDAYERNPLVS